MVSSSLIPPPESFSHFPESQTSFHINARRSTVYCNQCSVQLSYPAGSLYIQCPKCGNVMNPQAPQQTTCIACNTLLAHPPSSLYIQCPKCLTIMNTGDRAQQQQAQQQQQQAQQQQPHVQVPATMNPTRGPQTGMQPASNAANDFALKQAQNQMKPKKKRDPHAPKAASNAYMIFCKEMRPVLKKENTELSFGKIGARLGEMWRNLSAEGKKPYEDRAAADRERYRKEMENYQNAGGATEDMDEPAAKKLKADDFSDDEERFEENFGDAAGFYTQNHHQGHATQHHSQPIAQQAGAGGAKSSPLHSSAGLSGPVPTSGNGQSPSAHLSQQTPAAQYLSHHQSPSQPPQSVVNPHLSQGATSPPKLVSPSHQHLPNPAHQVQVQVQAQPQAQHSIESAEDDDEDDDDNESTGDLPAH